ncbi:MAG: hypothetical protein ACYC9W_07900, partial [Candidatus Limnocylindria bacterium]
MGRLTRLAALPLALLLVLALSLGGLARPVAARSIEPSANGRVSAPAPARIAPGQPRLLVKFAPGATAADQQRAIASVGGTVDRVLTEIG